MFGKGPGDRMSRSGQLPACVSCGSLERHRTVRAVWQPLVGAELRRLKAIQFSLDPSVNKDWFDYLEVSIYEKRNSLDLEDIYRLGGSYDIVICNHVLEHIEDDRRAFREIMRVLTSSGLFQFTVPLPCTHAVTEEWGYPDRPHGHYRLYGRDVIDRFAEARPGTRFLCVPLRRSRYRRTRFRVLRISQRAPAEWNSPGARSGPFPSLTVDGHGGSSASAGVRHAAESLNACKAWARGADRRGAAGSHRSAVSGNFGRARSRRRRASASSLAPARLAGHPSALPAIGPGALLAHR